jgi:hypothetical protein
MCVNESQPVKPIELSYATTPNRTPQRLATAAIVAAVTFVFGFVLLCSIRFNAGPLAVIVGSPFAALALGIAARATSDKRDENVRRRGRLAIEIACVELCIIALLAFATFNMGRPRETAKRVQCASHLRQIGQAMMLYANENGGQHPPTLEPLLATQDITSEVFCCPSSNAIKAEGATPQQVAQALAANPAKHLSYVYIGPHRNPPPPLSRRGRVVCYEPLDNHDGDGMNVLYENGSVEWLDEKRAKHALAELTAGHNPPRAAKP